MGACHPRAQHLAWEGLEHLAVELLKINAMGRNGPEHSHRVLPVLIPRLDEEKLPHYHLTSAYW